jgi:hypothetical protein
MKYLKRYKLFESNIRLEFEDIFREYNDSIRLSYQDQGDKIVCYIHTVGSSRVSISEVEELVLHFISFMMMETDSELISLSILGHTSMSGRKWINFYNEEPNRWGVYHPYYTGRDLNDLFDIQDLDKGKSFESIELKFRKI